MKEKIIPTGLGAVMSSTPSSSDTLLPSPTDDYPDNPAEPKSIDQPDAPTHFTEFIRGVSLCKWLLGLILPTALGLEIAHLVLLLRPNGVDEDWWGLEERMAVRREVAADIIGVGLTVCPPIHSSSK